MGSSTQIEEAAAAWIARRDAGDWSDADQAELTQWLHASTAHRVAFIRLDAAWQQANRLKALGAGVTPGVVPSPGEWGYSFSVEKPRTTPASSASAASGATPALRSTRFAHPYRALAASVVLAVALGAAWFLWPSGPTYRTPVGGLAAVPMPDGSKVTLNTDSEIRVAVTETERRVDLEQGEAFFEVARDPSRPFVVVAGDRRVIAVGTKFSVLRDEHDLRVVVTEGSVRMEQGSRGAPAPVTQLQAGAVARAGEAGTLVQEKPLSEAEEILSWRSGYLIFKDTTLAEAVAEFNRYNTHRIVIEDAAVAGISIGGNFRSTNVEAFVRLLEDGFPIRAERRDDRIVLTMN